MKRWFYLLSLSLWLVFGAWSAMAEVAPPVAPSAAAESLADSLSGPAKEAYASGQVLVHNGDFGGAYLKLKQAYELSKDSRLLWNMAVCEKNLHAYARMQRLLEQYVREVGPGISAETKTTVDAALANIQNLVGRVTLTVSEPGAAVTVDGEVAGTTPLSQALVLDLGKHEVVVMKAGFVAVHHALDVAGGTASTLDVRLFPERHVGRLLVASEDAATVTIDGRAVARGRFDGQVASGPHELGVVAVGKLPYRVHLDLLDGEMRSLDVTLRDGLQGGVPTWLWVVGGAVVAAGAVVGGYFMLKPQDTTSSPTGQLGVVHFGLQR
jgi:hypothetical protein